MGSVDNNHKIPQQKGTTLQLLYNNLRTVDNGDSEKIYEYDPVTFHIYMSRSNILLKKKI